MPRSASAAAVVAIIVALLSSVVLPGASGAPGSRQIDRELLPGVRHLTIDQEGPDAVINVARVAAGADVDLRVVSAHDQIAGGPDGGRELTSDMCRRAGGVVCINGDFAECPMCGQPIGGVVRDGRVLRSFHSAHHQLTALGRASFSTDRPQWSGRLVATYSWPNEPTHRQEVLGEDPGHRTETRTLTLDALNRSRPDGATVLFTPEWAPSTRTEGGYEAVLGTTEGVRPGSMPVTWRQDGGGDTVIPIDGVVVSAAGGDEASLRGFVDEWRSSDAQTRTLHLETALTAGAVSSIGAHPVLLRGGERQALDSGDNKVSVRHPRTLAGWTADGELLLVTVDGRQPGHSEGMTLHEAADLMARLGATDAVNLDGGGASTFVGPCDAGTCVLNRPSDRRERHVTTALAIVPRGPVVRAATGPPPPPPAPSPTPPPVEMPVHAPEDVAVEEAPADPATASAEPVTDDAVADVAPDEAGGSDSDQRADERRASPELTPVVVASAALSTTPSRPAPVSPLAGIAVIAVIANVAAMGWVHRRRVQPVLVVAISSRSGGG